jgi:NDP-sugar pyrophosphorylase family protein
MTPALVLTAGLATRLRPLSFVRAKAALPVGDQVIVERILRWLAGHGVTDAVLNLHHLPHTITAIVGDGMAGVRVRYSWETPVLGSAGGPRRALPLLGTSPFLIVNGDTLTNVDVGGLVDAHKRSGALVTMAVIPNVEPAKYGGVVVESDGTVTGFASAMASAARTLRVRDTYHFVGVQVAEADVFAPLRDDVPSESVKEVYPALIAARPGSVRAFVTDAEFFDIGTPSDYLSTCLRFEPHGSRTPDPGSPLQDCVVWDDVRVERNVRLRRCVLTDGVRVPAGSSWENMTVRVAHGELLASERLAGELAIGPIDGTARA